jgi:peptide/nickel transport system permease protein
MGLKYWWTIAYPGLFIVLFTLGWNLLGDALRDVLDPLSRRK